MNVLVLPNTKEYILKQVCNQAVLGHSRKTNTMEVNGAPEMLYFPHSSEYLQVLQVNKFIQFWNYLRVSKCDRIFIFG